MTHAYEALAELFEAEGDQDYLGEAVSMAQHMLQAGQAARDAGADRELVVAAVVHDVGHFSGAISGTQLMQGTDNHHDEAAVSWLGQWFGPEIIEPVRMHVDAKRYLCATDAAYYDQLSDASKYTMSVQGGPMSQAEVDAFASSPYVDAAVALRKFDDLGKDPNLAEIPLSQFRVDIEALDRTVTVTTG